MEDNSKTQSGKAQALREMIALAKQLREAASTTDDRGDRDLFLRTAAALEERANMLAYGDVPQAGPVIPHPHVDLLC